MSNTPPVVLVKTWLDLMRSKESDTVREHAKEKLLSAFGSVNELAEFIKNNGLH
tara:strand:+ start:334 stop:495 length:162 start_codon:yes stop_codon:yes gene_type:complete